MTTSKSEYNRLYREKNKAGLAAKEKAKREAIKDTPEYKLNSKEKQRRYYLNHKDEILKAIVKRRQDQHPHATRLYGIKNRAKRDGREFDLTLQFLSDLEVKTPNCPILGMPLIYSGTRDDFVDPARAALDRIDNSKGYTMDNVHFISNRANKIKNDATPDELRMIANYIESLGGNNV